MNVDQIAYKAYLDKLHAQVLEELRGKMDYAKKVNDSYTEEGGVEDIQIISHDVLIMCASIAIETAKKVPFYSAVNERGMAQVISIDYFQSALVFVPGAPVIAERIDQLPGDLAWYVQVRFTGFDLNMNYYTITMPVALTRWESMRQKECMTVTEVVSALTVITSQVGVPFTPEIVTLLQGKPTIN